MKEIVREYPYYDSLDVIIEKLLKAKEKGESAYCVFDGHILYSETVTWDSAYLEILGYTKAEKDRLRLEEEQMREIGIPWGSGVDSAIEKLLEAKAKGEKAFCVVNGHRLYSEIVTWDSAYIECFGYSKKEDDQRRQEAEQKRREMEQNPQPAVPDYKQMVAATRIPGQPVTIEMATVIAGLKFIAENRDLTQIELVQGLLSLGCNFTFEDIKEQFDQPDYSVEEGLSIGDISCGATVIVNMRDSQVSRYRCAEYLLDEDHDFSIYHFVRTVTGDDEYTKANLEKGKK